MLTNNQQNSNQPSLFSNNTASCLNSNKLTNSGKKPNQGFGNFGNSNTNSVALFGNQSPFQTSNNVFIQNAPRQENNIFGTPGTTMTGQNLNPNSIQPHTIMQPNTAIQSNNSNSLPIQGNLFGFNNNRTVQQCENINQVQVNGTFDFPFTASLVCEKEIKGGNTTGSTTDCPPTKFQVITALPQYSIKSVEELRKDDYIMKKQGRKANFGTNSNIRGSTGQSPFPNPGANTNQPSSFWGQNSNNNVQTNLFSSVPTSSGKGFCIGANPKSANSTPSSNNLFPSNNNNQNNLFGAKQSSPYNPILNNANPNTPTFGTNNTNSNPSHVLPNQNNTVNPNIQGVFPNVTTVNLTNSSNSGLFKSSVNAVNFNNTTNQSVVNTLPNQSGFPFGSTQQQGIIGGNLFNNNPNQQKSLFQGANQSAFKQPIPLNQQTVQSSASANTVPTSQFMDQPKTSVFSGVNPTSNHGNVVTPNTTNNVTLPYSHSNLFNQPNQSSVINQPNSLVTQPSPGHQQVFVGGPYDSVNNYIIYPSPAFVNGPLTGNVLGLSIDSFITKKIYDACSKNKTLDEILSGLKEENSERDLDSRIDNILKSAGKGVESRRSGLGSVSTSGTKKQYDFLKTKRKQDNREIERILQYNRSQTLMESGNKKRSSERERDEWVRKAKAHEYKRSYSSASKDKDESGLLSLKIIIMSDIPLEEDLGYFEIEINPNTNIEILKDTIVDKLRTDSKYLGISKHNFSVFRQSDILTGNKPLSVYKLKTNDKLYIAIDKDIITHNTRKRQRTEEMANLDIIPVLTKTGYHTKPSYPLICRMSEDQLKDIKDFEIYNEHGRIKFLSPVDIRELNLDTIVLIEPMRARLYDKPAVKPKKGEGLNVPCEIYLYNVKCRENLTEEEIKEYKEALMKSVREKGAKFIAYDEKESILVISINELNEF
jgi:hypothetical protein